MHQISKAWLSVNKRLKLLVILTSVVGVSVFAAGITYAVSSGWYPQQPPANPDSPGPNSWQYVTTSRVGGGSELQAPTSFLEGRFSSETTHVRFQTFNIGRQSSALDGGSAPATCTAGQVRVRVYGSNADGSINLSNYREYDPADLVANGDADACTGYAQFHFRLNGQGGFGSQLNAPNTPAGYKHLFFRVDLMSVVGGGGNKFKVEASGFRRSGTDNGFNVGNSESFLGFAANNSTTETANLPFSLVRGPLDPVPQDEHSVQWALPCTFAGSRLTLRWFDADNAGEGGNPADSGIDWYITNDTLGTRYNRPSGTNLGGNNVWAQHTIINDDFLNPEHKYTWHWTSVQGNNGIQMILPYSEATYDTTKCDWNYNPVIRPSTAAPGGGVSTPSAGANLRRGSEYQIEATVRNDGQGIGPRYNFRVDPINGGAFGLSTSSNITLTYYSDPASGNTMNNSNRTLLYPSLAFLSPNGEEEDRAQWGTCSSSTAVFSATCSQAFGGDPTPGSPRGLSPGETAPLTRQYRFRVNADATIGADLCFHSRVSSYNRSTPSTGQFRNSSGTICFKVSDDSTPTDNYRLENETATFDGGKTDPDTGCQLVTIGSTVRLRSTIDNTGGGDAYDNTGNVADARVNDGSIPPVGYRVGALINHDDIQIPGNSTVSRDFNQYTIPTTAIIGQRFDVQIFYLIMGTTPSFVESDFTGTTGQPRNASQSGPRIANACMIITDFAYMKAEGSGVLSGGVWQTLQECINSNFTVTAPQESLDDPNFSQIESVLANINGRVVGSSSEYGATSAFNNISGFASGIDSIAPNISSIPYGQNRLSFANVGNDKIPGNFLGSQTSQTTCLPDTFEHLKDKNPTRFYLTEEDLSATADNIIASSPYPIFYANVNDTCGAPPNVPPTCNTVQYSNGSNDMRGQVVALIEADPSSGGIDSMLFRNSIKYRSTYGDYNIDGTSKIPGLIIIVKGDILISGDATQMDGIYIAIPGEDSAGNPYGGNIITCAEYQTDNAKCNSQLTVNGALIANNIKFTRFGGEDSPLGVGGISREALNGGSQINNASEIIKFTPEIFLSNSYERIRPLLPDNTGFSSRYDYYSERSPIY